MYKRQVINKIKKILNDQKVGERIREGFKIAILGPTNAGKSSLMNHLSNRDVAIVSEIAGTTRDVIETHLNIDGYPVIISDTAGIRDSQDEIEKKGIRLALKRADDADLNIILIEPKSVDFTGFLNDLVSEKSIIVINKIDLDYKNINQQIQKFNPILISIKNETNLEELINRIKDKLKNKFVSSNETLITRERHRQSLEACVQNLINFEEKNSQEDFDKAAEDLRLATRHLGMIVGKVDVEEILGSIFTRQLGFLFSILSKKRSGVTISLSSQAVVLSDEEKHTEFTYFVPNQNQCSACHVTEHPDGEMHPLGADSNQLSAKVSNSIYIDDLIYSVFVVFSC